MASVGLELGVLGGLTAVVEGRPTDLGGFRQRALLAALIVAFPRDVSAERLLSQVWHDVDDPKTSSLHFAVSKLRDRLGPDRPRGEAGAIVRSGSRYGLEVGADQIDAVRFADLVDRGGRQREQGFVEESASSYAEALSLWRGSPYADVADAEFTRAEISRLTDLELRARKALLQMQLDIGRHDEAIGSAEELVTAHPLDERAWELLVIGLYRAGRQSDALAALRRVRGALDRDLGIEPGTRLRELESAVLNQDDERLLVRRAPARPVAVFPAAAPATPGPSTSNVPIPRTSLVAREYEIGTVGAALANSPLVTLVGPGGVGKTRLAIEVCRRLGSTADGPWMVDFTPVESNSLVITAIESALLIRGPGTIDHLLDTLATRSCTIVLDNCEHLLDGVTEVVAAMLDKCPDVRILATSREALAVDGEQVYEVEPLDEVASIELFGVRAAGVVPDWRLSDAVAEPVRRICTELDGIPLGLELAAAQLRVLSEEQIAEGLSDRFALLGGGARTAPARQRRLADTIDWSYRLLGEEESRLFREVGLFAGSFDIEGAAALHGDQAPLAILEPLTALVRRSLLRVEPASSPRRYRMLQTLKQFALSRTEGVELEKSRAAHRAFVLERAVAAEKRLRTSGSAEVVAALGRDQAEHRAAARSALAAGDPEYVLELVAALYWFWYRQGHIREGLEIIQTALDAVESVDRGVDDRILARVLTGLCGLTYLSGDPGTAGDAVGRAAEAARRAGDAGYIAYAESWQSYCRAIVDGPAQWEAQARASVEALRLCGEPWQLAEGLMIEGMILRFLGRLTEAGETLRAAVSTAERCGHGWPVGSASWTLMRVAMDSGDLRGALDTVPVMQSVFEAEGDVTSWLVLVHSTAAVVSTAGRTTDAARLLGAVRAQGSRLGFQPEAMDPMDAPREAAIVRAALTADEFEKYAALGEDMSRAEVNALMWKLYTEESSRLPRDESAVG
ncbi:MAG: BTAD domain-containing putative transcriptional regulator [Rhodococcus sp. (in: high G+C Gram-positive bacteria)]|uniref:BTAD domain-containing putative transcriptional regulator n=1 Tax=Rhodococcus sp. TaxID=1831 RepID=UPI003BB05569